MKVALVRPNYDSHIVTQPLGLGYLASHLKKAGFEPFIFDGLLQNITNKELLEQIIAYKPDIVGITCLTAFYWEAVDLARLIKQNNIKCILGGTHPTFLPYETLEETSADFVLCGEGEKAFIELLESNFKSDIRGIYSRNDLLNNKKKPVGEFAENIFKLDEIEMPAWELLDPNDYSSAPHGAVAKNYPIASIMTTRGCPYKCTFCASPGFYESGIRFRSPEKVIEEMKYLIENYGVKEFHFEDDNLTIKNKHITKLCNLIIENELNISWTCPNGIRADRTDREMIKLMKKAGCYAFAFGIESANATVLEKVKKLETIEEIEEAINISVEEGIECQGFFIFGLPGETKESIEETIAFAKRTKLPRAQFLILDVLPGTELWTKLQGKFTPNWRKQSYREPEWIPEGLTKEDLISAQTRAFRSFYFRPKTLWKMMSTIRPDQYKFLIKRITDFRILPKIFKPKEYDKEIISGVELPLTFSDSTSKYC
jgi:radical SAM superfamily enzyme YgiQ (UPF0313 family)